MILMVWRVADRWQYDTTEKNEVIVYLLCSVNLRFSFDSPSWGWENLKYVLSRKFKVFIWLTFVRVSQMKTLNMFYLVIYWTQKAHNDLIFLCSIVLTTVGHSSNYEYHCWNLQDNRVVVRIFISLLRFSVDSPS